MPGRTTLDYGKKNLIACINGTWKSMTNKTVACAGGQYIKTISDGAAYGTTTSSCMSQDMSCPWDYYILCLILFNIFIHFT